MDRLQCNQTILQDIRSLNATDVDVWDAWCDEGDDSRSVLR